MNSKHIWGRHTAVKLPKPVMDVFTLRERGIPIEALTTKCIECVYDGMEPREQFEIDCMVDQLEWQLKQGHGSRIGRVGAMELLAKIGILLTYQMPVGSICK
jgi:hypothetical protein